MVVRYAAIAVEEGVEFETTLPSIFISVPSGLFDESPLLEVKEPNGSVDSLAGVTSGVCMPGVIAVAFWLRLL